MKKKRSLKEKVKNVVKRWIDFFPIEDLSEEEEEEDY